MKRKVKVKVKVGLAVMLLLMFIALVGCSPDSTTTNTTSKGGGVASGTPKESGTLVINNIANYTDFNEYNAPKNGDIYVKVNMTLTNNSVGEGLATNPLYFSSETANASYTEAMMVTLPDAFNSDKTIKPGGSDTGSCIFEIPSGESLTKVIYNNYINKYEAVIK